MKIPRGICPECGTEHFGWALLNPCHQKCNWCGVQLVVEEVHFLSSGVELSRPLPLPEPRLDTEERTY